MIVYTKDELVREVRKNWFEAFCSDKSGKFVWCDKDSENIYNSLCTLGDALTASDVERIIGNDEWTTLKCAECNKSVKVVVGLDGGDYQVCPKCLDHALDLIDRLGYLE